MPETFILIPGRTSKQGCGISEGKFNEEYQSGDERPAGRAAGHGSGWGWPKAIACGSDQRDRTDRSGGHAAKGDELPPGLLFIAYGDLSSRLMGGDTHGSGMPTSKGLDVALEKSGSGIGAKSQSSAISAPWPLTPDP